MMQRYWRPLLFVAITIGLVFFLNHEVSAQCSMCRASLTGSNNRQFLQSFNTAVLVLLVPPVTIFCSIFIVLKKHAGSRDDQDTQ
jgi:hypothetical protein